MLTMNVKVPVTGLVVVLSVTSIGELSSAERVARVVVIATAVGLPEVELRVRDRLACLRHDVSGERERRSRDARGSERRVLRWIGLVVRTLGELDECRRGCGASEGRIGGRLRR